MTPFSGVTHKVPIPPCRDPFVNTPLLVLPRRGDEPERFWISTWNSAFGCLGVVLDTMGGCRVYRTETFRRPGFYCAVASSPTDLWLCGMADEVVHLDLDTGVFTGSPNDVPRSLVFAGMVQDAASGKLFAGSYSGDFVAWSFDTQTRQTGRVHRDFTSLHYMRDGWANGDGTYTCVLYTPGMGLLRWDPRTDEVAVRMLLDHMDIHTDGDLWYRTVADAAGRRFFPRFGWYNGAEDRFESGPEPDVEAGWFQARDERAYGLHEGRLLVWDWEQGQVSRRGQLEGADRLNIRLTADGLLTWVSKDGYHSVYDPEADALVSRQRLDTDAVQPVDCVLRTGPRTIIGTPFITQRFWQADMVTGEGADCGRAASGGGEVLRTWWLHDAAYMAAYTGSELVKYDPTQPARFPENPYVVATPKHAMRPVADATDGDRLWYASSRPYGELGSVVTAYDTHTGRTHSVGDPVPQQQINSLHYDATSGLLIGGSTPRADCDSAPPVHDAGRLLRLDAATLQAVDVAPAPTGYEAVWALGRLPDGRLWWAIGGPYGQVATWYWWALDGDTLVAPTMADMQPLPAGAAPAGVLAEPGHVLLRFGTRLEIWRYPDAVRVTTLIDEPDLCRISLQAPDIHVIRPWDIWILENALDPSTWTAD